VGKIEEPYDGNSNQKFDAPSPHHEKSTIYFAAYWAFFKGINAKRTLAMDRDAQKTRVDQIKVRKSRPET
jgi:hypothetical protein